MKSGRAGFWVLVIVAQAAAVTLDAAIFRGQFEASGFVAPADLRCFQMNGALVGHYSAAAAAAADRLCAFMYPPPFLLIAVPLSHLGPVAATCLLAAVPALGLAVTAWRIGLRWPAILLGLMSPPSLLCAALGQDGGVTSILLLGALGLADMAPIAAGLMAGGLVIKPQLAIVLPFCFLASRNWRAFGAAIVSVALICLVTTAWFGGGVWTHFAHVQLGAAHGILTLPWPQPPQHILISGFIFLRALGAGLPVAFAGQALSTVLSLGAVWRLWSRPVGQEARAARLAATICLAMLATPFSYVYDLPGAAYAVAGYTLAVAGRPLLPIALFWLITSLYLFISIAALPVGAPMFLALLVLFWRDAAGPGQGAHAG